MEETEKEIKDFFESKKKYFLEPIRREVEGLPVKEEESLKHAFKQIGMEEFPVENVCYMADRFPSMFQNKDGNPKGLEITQIISLLGSYRVIREIDGWIGSIPEEPVPVTVFLSVAELKDVNVLEKITEWYNADRKSRGQPEIYSAEKSISAEESVEQGVFLYGMQQAFKESLENHRRCRKCGTPAKPGFLKLMRSRCEKRY